MRNDLQEIKQRLFEEDKVEELLTKLGCQNIRYVGGRFEAQLPNGKDKRSVQVYNQENLKSAIRTRGVDGDIYSIISYIKYDCATEHDRTDNLPQAKMWIVEEFGYHDLLDKYKDRKDMKDYNSWLKDLKKKRKKKRKVKDVRPNSPIDEKVIKSYLMLPYQGWVDEGIDYDTQVKFEVGFDWVSKRIVTMIRNGIGELIGIKGRTLDKKYKEKDIPKYIYLEKLDKSIELYNFHRAVVPIIDKKEVIVFEGYKSCMLSDQFGYENCVSMEGDSLSDVQVDLIKGFGLDVNVVICYDKDKKPLEIVEEARKINGRKVYIVYDKHDWLNQKDSPVDQGAEVWEELYKSRYDLDEFIRKFCK